MKIKCKGEKNDGTTQCPKRDTCTLYTAPASTSTDQLWFAWPPIKGDNCNHYQKEKTNVEHQRAG